jgi:hypothetical protein
MREEEQQHKKNESGATRVKTTTQHYKSNENNENNAKPTTQKHNQ